MHKSGKLVLTAAVSAIAAMLLAACGSGTDDTGTSGGTTASQEQGTDSGDTGTTDGDGGETSEGGDSEPGSEGGGDASSTIAVGTTDQVVSLDPAFSYDNGSLMLEVQLYQYLMVIPPDGDTPQPDAAESCDFSDDGTQYICTMKDGLTFSNGDPLTAEDAAFSFQRVVDIADASGPASLLAGMASVEATDEKTVVFTLTRAFDQVFPFILGSAAGPIVNKNIYPADGTTPLADEDAIGSGPYMIDSYSKNQLVSLVPNPNYDGNGGTVANAGVTLQYYADASNLKLAVQEGDIDVAWRSLDPESINDLGTMTDKVKVWFGPGGEDRYIVFNLNTMPGDSPEGRLAVRRAIAYSIDRDALSNDVYQGQYKPAWSMIPEGMPGHIDAFKDEFGETPNIDAATKELADAGVATPVVLPIQYNGDHYGSQSDAEYNEIKRQLEATGLFQVDLQQTEWTTYAAERTQDAYPIYQLGWFPDYPDADTYLSPFLVEDNFVGAHYCDKDGDVGSRPCDIDKIQPLLDTEATASGQDRIDAIEEIQKISASGQMPTLPLLMGQQIAVSGLDVGGLDHTLDASFLFRFWVITK